MIPIKIDNKPIEVPEGITVIQACEIAKVEIPRFCYHEKLKIAGNCRMCLVQLKNVPKPVASCATNIAPNMEIFTRSEMVKRARAGVSEFLLINHPLDCPICDQAGECDLQDQTLAYGSGFSRFSEEKRAVKEKDLGFLVQTQMTRCIDCTRCVRFMADIAGTGEMGSFGRGENIEVSNYLSRSLTSELSGNIIDLCPVGALTSKPYSSTARSWELSKVNSIDIMDAIGSNIRVDARGYEVMRIVPRINEEINEEWISDKSRFSYDGLKYQRLDKSYIRKRGTLEACNLDAALEEICIKFQQLHSSEIAALSGDLVSVDENFALKSLLQQLEIDQIDCRTIGSEIDPKDRSSYIFNSKITGIDQADYILLIGVNPRKESPIINARIRRAAVERDVMVASIGFVGDLTYEYSSLGDDISELLKIFGGKSKICKNLENAKFPMLVFGDGVMNHKKGDDILNLLKAIAKKYDVVKDGWNGFNALHHNAALTGALDIGFVSSKTDSRKIIKQFNDGKIKLLYLLGVDNSNLAKLIKRTEKNSDSFIVYQGSHGDIGAELADIILPSATYTEKSEIYVNIEGRVQETAEVVPKIDGSYNSLEIFSKMAILLNVDLGFKTKTELRQKLEKENEIFGNMNQIRNNDWIAAKETKLKGDEVIKVTDFNFYQTNAISRSSKIMNNFS